MLGGESPPPSANDLTMLAYTVRKAESGALHRLLEPFARHGVNLTSIQARPLKGAPWEYVFFIDLEGHHERAARAGGLRGGGPPRELVPGAGLLPARARGAARGGGR